VKIEVNMLRHFFKGLAALAIVAMLSVFTAIPVLAADFPKEDTFTVASGEVVDDDIYVGATTITIDGTVNGDIYGFGNTITINGVVNGSVCLGGQTVIVNGEITHSARLGGNTIIINGDIGGDLMVAGNTVNVATTAIIGRDLLFGASKVRLDGPVGGYIYGGGSEVTITSTVTEDIELGVDSLTIVSTANLKGNLTYTSENEANIQSGAQIGGMATHKMPETKSLAQVTPFSGIWGKVIAYLMTLLAGIVIILIAPRRASTVADSIRHKPWVSLGWGAIILFATPIAVIITLITVVGVPLGVIGLILYGIGIYLSQLVVGLFLGYWIIGYFRKVETRGILVGALALGFAVLTLVKLIPYVGYIVVLAAILFGLGALLVSTRRPRVET